MPTKNNFYKKEKTASVRKIDGFQRKKAQLTVEVTN